MLFSLANAIRSMDDDSSPARDEVTCRECGAPVDAGASHCWMCKAPLMEAPKTSEPAAKAISGQDSTGALHGAQFRLSTLMLAVTLIAVFLGVARLNIGLGILLAILVTPAMIRASLAARKRRGEGTPMSAEEGIAAFFGSLGVVIAVGLAAGVAFYVTCWAGVLGGLAVNQGSRGFGPVVVGFYLGIAAGLAAGIAVGVFLLRRLWPFGVKAKKQSLPDPEN